MTREASFLASLKFPSWSNFWYYIRWRYPPQGSRNFPTMKYTRLAILVKKISPRQPENLEKDRKTHVQLPFNHSKVVSSHDPLKTMKLWERRPVSKFHPIQSPSYVNESKNAAKWTDHLLPSPAELPELASHRLPWVFARNASSDYVEFPGMEKIFPEQPKNGRRSTSVI